MLAPTGPSAQCPEYHGPVRCTTDDADMLPRVSEQQLVANIDESRILCGHCGIMCKFDARVTFELGRSPL